MTDSKLEIDSDGTKRWRNKRGQLHRENGPAIIYQDNDMCWYLYNNYHRIDGPSDVYINGKKYWYINDKFIRKFVYDY